MPARRGASQAALRSASAQDPYAAEIWTCLEELYSVSSRSALRHGRLRLAVDSDLLADFDQFIDALRGGCKIRVVLERGFNAAPNALLERIIELIDVVRRGTRADFVFEIEEPQDRATLEVLWQRHPWEEVDGVRPSMPPFVKFQATESPDTQQGPWYPRHEL